MVRLVSRFGVEDELGEDSFFIAGVGFGGILDGAVEVLTLPVQRISDLVAFALGGGEAVFVGDDGRSVLRDGLNALCELRLEGLDRGARLLRVLASAVCFGAPRVLAFD